MSTQRLRMREGWGRERERGEELRGKTELVDEGVSDKALWIRLCLKEGKSIQGK